MNIKAALPVIISLILTACTQHTPSDKTPVVGEAVDSVAIANDTVQQENIEGSYEYAQTIIVSPKLAYDVRAYGGPASHGQYCILRRGADNKTDTVVQRERLGVIVNTFTADLNNNGKEEIYVSMRNPVPGSSCHISGFEFDKDGKADTLNFGNTRQQITANTIINYHCDSVSKSDSIYAFNGLLLKYYYCGRDRASDRPGISWKLEGHKFIQLPNY